MKADLYIGRGDGVNFDGPYTVAQIDGEVRQDASVADKLSRKVAHPGMGLHWQEVDYDRLPRFPVEFDPEIEALIASRKGCSSTVFSGPNNSGKSLILKQMLSALDHHACLLTCNRYSPIDVINTQPAQGSDERKQHYDMIVNHLESGQYHDDQNPRQLEQLIRGLTDVQLDRLVALAGELLGSKIQMLRADSTRARMSPWYVDLDGQSLKYASSGTRLLFMLLGHLFDEYFQIALVDEPEIGLSPKIQAALARALYDAEIRRKYFPHLGQVFVVTHSHLFLDRAVLSNNYIVEKGGDMVTTRPVASTAELHDLQFRMLGNDLDHLYMPAAIIVVEGPCDTFMSRLFTLHTPNRRVSMVVSHGDGRIPEKVQTLSEGLGELTTSPYRSRLFVILDARYNVKKSALERQGVLPDNIHVWTKNGIEWYYPKKHVAAAFKCSEADLTGVDLGQERITVKAITHTKAELAKFVIPRVTLDDPLDAELTTFLDKAKRATS